MTMQAPNFITYDGVLYQTGGDPFESLFSSPDYKKPDCSVMSTACSRGYQAHWIVVQGELFLIRFVTLDSELGLNDFYGEKIRLNQKFEHFTGDLYLFDPQICIEKSPLDDLSEDKLIGVKSKEVYEFMNDINVIGFDKGVLSHINFIGRENCNQQVAEKIERNVASRLIKYF